MKLNDLPTRQDKKQFIDGFLKQHREFLFGLLDDVPENWNSWHLRKLIRDSLICYELSIDEEKEYEDVKEKILYKLKTPRIKDELFNVEPLINDISKFMQSDEGKEYL